MADFWKKEHGAPLLRRNANFVTSEVPQSVRERLGAWPALCGAKVPAAAAAGEKLSEDEALERLLLRDAERTFLDDGHRKRMIEVLKQVLGASATIADYHQGLGYTCSLLMLFFDAPTARAILSRLPSEKYSLGYWAAAPEPYVRDAMVYGRLVEEREPQVAALLQQACIVPEAYASKWFIGNCVHVLPYAALVDFFEAFLREGHPFLFKFALALIGEIKPRLLTFGPTEVNKILEALRLDDAVYPDDTEGGAFFTRIVASAVKLPLEPGHIAELRKEEGAKLEEKMRRTREREAQMAEESDDEIVFSDEEDD